MSEHKAETGDALDESKFVTFEGSPFQLYQPYPPAGDQPTAIQTLVEGVEDGLSFQTLLGVTGRARPSRWRTRSRGSAARRSCSPLAAAQLYSEFREFFPRNAVEYFVSYYDYYQPEAYVPQRDLFIEKDSSINEHIEQMRLSATKSLMERRDVVIVATVSAIYGIGNPSEYHQMILTLRAGDKLGQRDVIARLIAMQYTRNEQDFQRGTFRVRGDTIDIFPAEHAELAVRVELFDDEVETLQLFDPLTGRVRQKIPRFTVYPSSHYVTPRDTVMRAVETIRTNCASASSTFTTTASSSRRSASSSARASISRCCRARLLQGHRELLATFLGRGARRSAADLVDYLPPDALMLLDESHVLIGQLNGMYNGDRARKKPRQLRVPAAVGAGQPAAEVPRVRTQDAPGRVRVGHAGRLREA